ncbi:spore protease YyaC [Paenibacillus sp. FJAT-26967]|uniref:spore protease YyaC n=1 Tax=Paenibacillus sp. FJAT-26967 TaxID=1729690 RepID=UPI00083986A4|nr:spore protease YyaC [Paenibacillus sp. FJAT-26967]
MKPFGIPAKPADKPASIKLPHSDNRTPEMLAAYFTSILKKLPSYQPIVIVCVGTDRSTGDSLGPLVGSNLKKRGNHSYSLYGTLDEPVHAINLADTLTTIGDSYRQPFIVAIDACLGQVSSVGSIQVGHGPLKPGAGVNKELPAVGDIHVTGIVNVGGFMEYFVLQNTRLSLVMNMSDVIASSLHQALYTVRHVSPTSALMSE